MKKKIVFIGIAALLLFGLNSAKAENRPQPSGQKVTSILFIGDSNTFYDYSYAHSLSKKFPNLRTKIIAKVGEKTSWMLNELSKELVASKYDVVAILGGSNDIYALNENKSAKQYLNKIYQAAHNSGARVLAIAPPNKDYFIKRTEQKQKLLRDLVQWISINPNKDWFVNFWSLTNNQAFFDKKDGYLHAQKPAHDILVQQVITTLNLKGNDAAQ